MSVALFASFMRPCLPVAEISPRLKQLSLPNKLSLCSWETLRPRSNKQNLLYLLVSLPPSLLIFIYVAVWAFMGVVRPCMNLYSGKKGGRCKIVSDRYPAPSLKPTSHSCRHKSPLTQAWLELTPYTQIYSRVTGDWNAYTENWRGRK